MSKPWHRKWTWEDFPGALEKQCGTPFSILRSTQGEEEVLIFSYLLPEQTRSRSLKILPFLLPSSVTYPGVWPILVGCNPRLIVVSRQP